MTYQMALLESKLEGEKSGREKERTSIALNLISMGLPLGRVGKVERTPLTVIFPSRLCQNFLKYVRYYCEIFPRLPKKFLVTSHILTLPTRPRQKNYFPVKKSLRTIAGQKLFPS